MNDLERPFDPDEVVVNKPLPQADRLTSKASDETTDLTGKLPVASSEPERDAKREAVEVQVVQPQDSKSEDKNNLPDKQLEELQRQINRQKQKVIALAKSQQTTRPVFLAQATRRLLNLEVKMRQLELGLVPKHVLAQEPKLTSEPAPEVKTSTLTTEFTSAPEIKPASQPPPAPEAPQTSEPNQVPEATLADKDKNTTGADESPAIPEQPVIDKVEFQDNGMAKLPTHEGARIVVGEATGDVDIALINDLSIKGVRFTLTREDGKFVLKNEGLVPIYFNRQRVEGKMPLPRAAILEIGANQTTSITIDVYDGAKTLLGTPRRSTGKVVNPEAIPAHQHEIRQQVEVPAVRSPEQGEKLKTTLVANVIPKQRLTQERVGFLKKRTRFVGGEGVKHLDEADADGYLLQENSIPLEEQNMGLCEDRTTNLGDAGYVVIDGMGGPLFGRQSAQLMESIFKQEFAEAKSTDTPQMHQQRLQRALEQTLAAFKKEVSVLKRRFPQATRNTRESNFMGVTFSLAIMAMDRGKPVVVVYNQGDARSFAISENSYRPLTTDHDAEGQRVYKYLAETLVQSYDPDGWAVKSLQPNEVVGICSDGLTGNLTDKEVQELYVQAAQKHKGDLTQIVLAITEAAKEAKRKSDDISLALVKQEVIN